MIRKAYNIEHVYMPIEEHCLLGPYGTPVEPRFCRTDYCKICFIRSGKCTIIAENIHIVQQAPCMIFYNCNCASAQFNDENFTYEKYMITVRDPSPFIASVCHQLCTCTEQPIVVIPLKKQQVDWLFQVGDHLLDLLLEEKLMDSDETFLRSYHYLLQESLCILRKQPHAQYSYEKHSISNALSYISDHLTENISLTDISSHIHVGKTKLNSDFRRFLSMSVHQYILKERLTLARQYLLEGYTVSTTAAMCGFCNDAHFIQSFKQKFSVTPGSYQKALTQNHQSMIMPK